jgi:hypothetical protein
MEKELKAVEDKMKKALQKQREIHTREMQNVKVRFPTHTTNVYHSTFIQPSAVPMSTDSLPNVTSL